jgi:hypothetical protein
MAITVLSRGSRRRNHARLQTQPSLREVCLLGVPDPQAEGSRLTWSGRAYQVESAQDRAKTGAAVGYIHLSLATAPAREPVAG